MSKHVFVTFAVEVPDDTDIMDVLSDCEWELKHGEVLDMQLHEIYNSEGKRLF